MFAVKQSSQSFLGEDSNVPAPIPSTAEGILDANHDAAMSFKERFQGGVLKRPISSDDSTSKRSRSSLPIQNEIDIDIDIDIDIEPTRNESATNPEAIDIDDDYDDDDDNNGEAEGPLRIIPIKPIEALMPKKKLSKEEMEKAKEELKRRIAEKEQSMFDKYKQTIQDEVKLHESGWKDRYYGEKHKKENIAENGGLSVMCRKYIHGLCWVLKYYYEGVPSWNWYYPFHYAPFASDLLNIERYGPVEFEKSEPFRPVEQLLAVLPSNSVHALPEPCRWLMTDASSPIIDLYNNDVPIDPNGKHLPWLWILLLPFVDESRITAAFSICKPDLSLQDRRRNAFGGSVLFVHKDSNLATYLFSRTTYAPGNETDVEVLDALGAKEQYVSVSITTAFDATVGWGMSGEIGPPPPLWFAPLDETIESPQDEEEGGSNSNSILGMMNSIQSCIYNNSVAVLTYMMPPAPEVHQSRLLDGAFLSPSILTSFDLIDRKPPRLNKAGFSILDMLRAVRNKNRYGRQNDFSRSQYDNQGYSDPSFFHQSQSLYNGSNIPRDSYDRPNQWSQPPSMYANPTYPQQSYNDQYRQPAYNNNQSYPYQQKSLDYHPRPPQTSNYREPAYHSQRVPNYSEGNRRPDGGYSQSYGPATTAHHSQLPSFGHQLARGGQPSLVHDMPGRGDVDRRGSQYGSTSRSSEQYSHAPPRGRVGNAHPAEARRQDSSRYGDRLENTSTSRGVPSDGRSASGYGRQAPPQPHQPQLQQQFSRHPYSHHQEQHHQQQQQQHVNQQQYGRPISNGPAPRSSYSHVGSGAPGPPPRYNHADARPPAAFAMNPAAAPFYGSQKPPNASTSSQIGSMQSIRDQLLQTVNAVKRK